MGKGTLERKAYFDGKEDLFQCELIYLSRECGILKYVTERAHSTGDLFLPAGTVSYGFFFRDEPFVLYRWFSPQGKLIGDYFNVADKIRISEKEFFWRDLFVDVLVRPSGKVDILDENEVPNNLEESLLAYIQNAKERILSIYPLILEKADEMMENLIWRKK